MGEGVWRKRGDESAAYREKWGKCIGMNRGGDEVGIFWKCRVFLSLFLVTPSGGRDLRILESAAYPPRFSLCRAFGVITRLSPVWSPESHPVDTCHYPDL